MIKEYKCKSCGHIQDEWRFSSEMPGSVTCKKCSGLSFPVDKIYKPMITFKGEGWTPSRHSTVSEVALEGDTDE